MSLRRARHRASFAVLGSLGVTLPAASHADAPTDSVYRINPAVDLPVLGLGTAAALAAFIEVSPSACLPSCEPPDNMPGFDRVALGNYSPRSHSIADGLVAALIVAPPIMSALDAELAAALEDTFIHLQTLALAQGATQLMKFAVQRPAPLVYDETVPLSARQTSDAARSFWSGHTATAFATATSATITFWLRHPRAPERFIVLVTYMSAATAVGALKIDAGNHYPTDIVAGGLAGASIGALVPLLHRRF
jgi:membrane-associated phospholipid phosphatase